MSEFLLIGFVIGVCVGVLAVATLFHFISVLVTRRRSGWYNGKI